MQEVYANNAQGVVTSGGTTAPSPGTVETWTVQVTSAFGSASTGLTQFHVGDTAPGTTTEKILVTNGTGGPGTQTWTVTRGAEGTAPLAHAPNFVIHQVVTAGVFSGFGTGSSTTARTVTVTVGPPGVAADFVCTGTHDGAVIQSAISSLPATGGKVLIRDSATAYDFSASSDRLSVAKPNVMIEGESFGGVVFKANASLFPGGSTAQGKYGVLTVGATQTALQSDVVLRNLVINCNSQLKTGGLTLDGGSAMTGQTGLQNVFVEYVQVQNMCQSMTGDVESGVAIESGTNTALGNRGYVDKVTFWRCDLGPSANEALMLQGTNITNLRIAECRIHDCQGNGAQIYDYGGPAITNSDWLVEKCRFENNMITLQSTAIAHFRDQTQVGVNNFSFINNYVGPAANPGATGLQAQDYIITPYCAANNRVTGNLFDRCGNGISLGRSQSGSEYRTLPLNRIFIADNVFYSMRQCFDPDASHFMQLRGNIFYGIKAGPVMSPYSDHWPTIIEDNLFYDCNASDSAGPTDTARSIIRLTGNGFTIRNNHFIEDRVLANPAANVNLSQISGGSQGARTYYVKYTWSNATGETLPSPEQTLAISANNLMVINSGSGGPAPPPGATQINYYVAASSGAETLQASVALPALAFTWTEPTSGLVFGASPPGSNTTVALTAYGIYEETGGGTSGVGALPNVYSGNQFYGFPSGHEIVLNSTYSRVFQGNITNPAVGAGSSRMIDTTSVSSQSGGYSLGPGDGTVLVTATATATLPDATLIPGVKYTVKNTGTGTATVATTSAQTIDGAATQSLTPSQALTVISDGSNWQSLSSGGAVAVSDLVTQRILNV